MFVPAIINNPIAQKYNELVEMVQDNETIQQVLYTLATIVGIIVGVTVWVANRVRQWYINGGKFWMLKVARTVLLFITTTTERAYYWVCDVPVSEVAQ